MSAARPLTPTPIPIDKKLIAQEFAARAKGKLEPEKVDSITRSLVAQTTAYPATGSVASMIFYLKFQVNITGGESFNGNAGGLSTPGGALFAIRQHCKFRVPGNARLPEYSVFRR